MRVIKLLKQRQRERKVQGTSRHQGLKKYNVINMQEMKQEGFVWHKKFSSIVSQTLLAILRSVVAKMYFPLGYNLIRVLFFRNVNHVAREIFLLVPGQMPLV